MKEMSLRLLLAAALGVSALPFSIHGFGADSDPSRVAAGGIGFLGAGAWAVAAIGLTAGAGLYLVAAITTVLVMPSSFYSVKAHLNSLVIPKKGSYIDFS
ncbi:hypothetical protein M1M86_00665 [Dehalococcoidales bacterium]|nr:hypothetical protein [Dehalococcoidales bacterium]